MAEIEDNWEDAVKALTGNRVKIPRLSWQERVDAGLTLFWLPWWGCTRCKAADYVYLERKGSSHTLSLSQTFVFRCPSCGQKNRAYISEEQFERVKTALSAWA